MTAPRIPVNDLALHTRGLRPALDDAIARVLDRGWFVLGPEVDAFESELASWCGVPHAVGVANGTDALELALRAVGVLPGERVATVANAGLYSTVAIVAAGARPVFAEVDPESLLMDPAHLERTLADAPVKAIVVTHLYGRLADVGSIASIAEGRGAALIEDCAQAHGARLGERRAGSIGDAGCFSFYPTKNLGALGDGGAVVTSRDDVAERLRRLRQYGWTSKYRAAEPLGRNSRLDEVQAAILRVQLPRLEEWNRRRRQIARRYAEGIVHRDVRRAPFPAARDDVAHLYVVQVDAGRRNDLRRHLDTLGIATDVHYPVPDHRQAALAAAGEAARLAVTEAACERVLTLPCFPELGDEEVDRVIAAVNAW